MGVGIWEEHEGLERDVAMERMGTPRWLADVARFVGSVDVDDVDVDETLTDGWRAHVGRISASEYAIDVAGRLAMGWEPSGVLLHWWQDDDDGSHAVALPRSMRCPEGLVETYGVASVEYGLGDVRLRRGEPRMERHQWGVTLWVAHTFEVGMETEDGERPSPSDVRDMLSADHEAMAEVTSHLGDVAWDDVRCALDSWMTFGGGVDSEDVFPAD